MKFLKRLVNKASRWVRRKSHTGLDWIEEQVDGMGDPKLATVVRCIWDLLHDWQIPHTLVWPTSLLDDQKLNRSRLLPVLELLRGGQVDAVQRMIADLQQMVR